MKSVSRCTALLALAGSACAHAAMLWPPQMPFTKAFLRQLPRQMRAFATHRESYGQDIPMYLLQTTNLEYAQQYGLAKPRNGAWTEPCRVKVPTGKTYKMTPGGTTRVKTQNDVSHGGDYRFAFYRMVGATLSTGDVQLGEATWARGAGNRVDSGAYRKVGVPKEVAVCKGGVRCYIRFSWATSKRVDSYIQHYVGCALVAARK